MVSGGAATVGLEVLFIGAIAALAINESGKKQDANGAASDTAVESHSQLPNS